VETRSYTSRRSSCWMEASQTLVLQSSFDESAVVAPLVVLSIDVFRWPLDWLFYHNAYS
jgi:hypothetical protein